MSHRVISTILRFDAKQTSYKIALLRALNDAVLAYPDLRFDGRDVAVPLRSLAESWVAYCWPFVAADAPIDQGVRSRLGERERHDLAFRPHLTELRRRWEAIYGPSDAAGGWHLVEHLRAPRHRDGYPAAFLKAYAATLRQVRTAPAQPIQYAGPGHWSVFAKPATLGALEDVAAVPGARAGDVCVVVPADLWQAFRDVSLWVEALCIHEWSLFTERVAENAPCGVAYALLTERRLAATYAGYARAAELDRALRADVALRFARAATGPPDIARAVVDLVASIAEARNLPRF